MSETLQRYNPEPTCIQSNSTTLSGAALRQHSEGIVVLHADAQKRIEKLEEALHRAAERKMPDGSLCWCLVDERMSENEKMEHESRCEAIRAALRK